jgi:homoserine dehydrogenase
MGNQEHRFNNKTVKIALLGLGTVGTGIIKAIRLNADKQIAAFGANIKITGILVKNKQKSRSVEVEPELLYDDYDQLVSNRDCHVVIEVMGGIEPAKSIIIDSLLQKRHVITANKELMAKHGDELLELAGEQGVHLLYEASVGGGIPLLGTISQFLRFNEINSITGILNGTTNYILTRMMAGSMDYGSALREAQLLGYAEADPTSDVEGLDAMYKLMIVSRLAWGITMQPEHITCRGISSMTSQDIDNAKENNAKWKLIASAEKDQRGQLSLRVEPQLISEEHPLYGIDHEFNAVTICGNIVGPITLSGRGAGDMPTSSAVLGDLSYALTHPVINSSLAMTMKSKQIMHL